MNRVIKFRCWIEFEKRMAPIVVIDFEGMLVRTHHDEEIPWVNTPIMQFTGLLDKNGKEIYEGDVIQFMRAGQTKRVAVEWDDYDAGFRYITQNPLDNEVIGNIYENPDLIEKP